MNIRSAKFIKGVVGEEERLEDGTPQVAFVGRSNAGKSSIINSLTGEKDLARISAFPGLTQEINVYWINKSLYLLDLPGYGFAKESKEGRKRLQNLIKWYLFESDNEQKKVVLVIDAKVGPTDNDFEMLESLENHNKNVVVVANKIDKIKKSEQPRQLEKIKEQMHNHKVIAYSSVDKIGRGELAEEILK